MKTLILILITSNISFANDIEILTDSIAEFCEIYSQQPEEQKIQCVEKLTNCIIGVDGNWEDDLLFNCIREYDRGMGALNSSIRSVSEKEKLQRRL